MVLLGNDCAVGYLYRDVLCEQYASPTIWTKCFKDDFITFIKTINEIRLDKFICLARNADTLSDFYVKLHNGVKFECIHNKFDISAITPIVRDVDTYYCKPWEYITQKWLTRCNRMRVSSFEPVIVLHINLADPDFSTDNERQLYISNVITAAQKAGKKLIVLTDFNVVDTRVPHMIIGVKRKWQHEFKYNAETFKQLLHNVTSV